MRHDCVRSILFGSFVIATTALASAPALAASPYDGNWNVTVVTKTGSCEPMTSSTLTVMDGKISAPGAEVPSGAVVGQVEARPGASSVRVDLRTDAATSKPSTWWKLSRKP